MSAIESGLRQLIAEVVREEMRKAEERRGAEFLTTEHAAAVADVSTATVRRWVRDGRLREHRVGRQLRVRRGELEEMMCAPASNDRGLSPEALADLAFERRRSGRR